MRWTDLANVPLVVSRSGYGVRRLIDGVATKAGVELQIVNEVSFLPTALWMVASGLGGAAIFPAALVTEPYENLVTKPLVAPVVTRSIGLITQRGRSLSPACESFVEVLRQSLARR